MMCQITENSFSQLLSDTLLPPSLVLHPSISLSYPLTPLFFSILCSDAVQHLNRHFIRSHLHVALQQSDVIHGGSRHTGLLSSQTGTGVVVRDTSLASYVLSVVREWCLNSYSLSDGDSVSDGVSVQ